MEGREDTIKDIWINSIAPRGIFVASSSQYKSSKKRRKPKKKKPLIVKPKSKRGSSAWYCCTDTNTSYRDNNSAYVSISDKLLQAERIERIVQSTSCDFMLTPYGEALLRNELEAAQRWANNHPSPYIEI